MVRSETLFFVVLSSVGQWYILPVAIAALFAVAAALFGLRSMRKRSEATKFYRLHQQVQMQGFAEEDDEVAFAYSGKAPKP
jgi:Flp pilus assembly protein TadB